MLNAWRSLSSTMNNRTWIGAGIAVAVVAGILLALQNFHAEEVACDKIDAARASLQSMYDAGVNASVQVYAGERATADETLSRCLSAKPADPCDDAQKARDAAVKNYEGIASPADTAPYAEFQTYYKKRDDAYNAYKKAKDVLDQCRAANPLKGAVPYEKSDTKKCFDAYDASIEAMRDTFEKNTQAMRSALKAALAALDAREKACHPPAGKDAFTNPPQLVSDGQGGMVPPVELQNCQLISPDLDTELFLLRRQAAGLPGEIQAAQDSINNAQKRLGPVETALRDVGTYIPPEAAKTQFEGALNGIRSERKTALEASVNYYKNLIAKRQAEKAALQKQLDDLNAQIAARLSQIQKENAARMRAFPTYLHQAKPDECGYYHCHGMLCGKPDPAPHACGHGKTTQGDTDCKQFIKAYLQAGGVK